MVSATASLPPRPLRSLTSYAARLRIDRRTVLPIAIALALVGGVLDAATGADAVFTLVYLAPIGMVVWYRGRRAGYAMIALSTLLAHGYETLYHTRHIGFVLWNVLGELGLYTLFAFLLNLMKDKLRAEAQLRRETLTQLRHADRLTTVGRLAAGLAHELGTPLNVVSGKASLISSGRLAGDSAKRAAVTIEKQADRMTVIIRHLLDFARRGGTGRQPTSLHALAIETAELLRPLASRVSVELRCEGDGDALASVNRAELQQVISNLLTNAIFAMPKGGVVRLVSGVDAPLGMATLKVIDEGDGIPLEVLPRIFDPFFTTKDVGQGTGLGLSVVLGIVDDHGGTIEVESEIGHGATFTLHVPLAP